MVTSRMTTAQESPNGHHPLPPPCSFPDLQDDHRSKDSSDNNSNPDSAPAPATRETETFAANAYHVPPKHYAPRANSYQGDDFSSFDRDPNQLPDRCQFTFSDGRQCTMARSEIHPSLCRFHSEREDQLFGDPAPGGNVVGAALDLPELYSACRDLTTASGVNRALGQVFRLLAQRRISRQEAATFGHLAQLLLRTISAMRVLAGETPAANVYQHDELRGVDKDHQELSPDNKVAAGDRAPADGSLTLRREANAAPASSAQADDATSIVIPNDGPERGISPAPPVNIVTPLLAHKKVALSPLSSSRVNEVHAASPPNSQLSQNEHIRGTRLQLAQNEHLPNLST